GDDLSPLAALRPGDVDQVFVAGFFDLANAKLLARFNKLRRLHVYWFAKDLNTAEGYAALGQLKNLESLTLECENGVFGDNRLLKELAGLKRLRHVDFFPADISDQGIESLRDHVA